MTEPDDVPALTAGRPGEPDLATRRRRARQVRRARERARAWRGEFLLLAGSLLAGAMFGLWMTGAGVGGAWGWATGLAGLLYAGSLLLRIAYLARSLPIAWTRKRIWGVPGLVQARQRRLRRSWH
ncbi:MAG: hypothetical protein ACOC02_03335, partial [Guyparkeria sp.]